MSGWTEPWVFYADGPEKMEKETLVTMRLTGGQARRLARLVARRRGELEGEILFLQQAAEFKRLAPAYVAHLIEEKQVDIECLNGIYNALSAKKDEAPTTHNGDAGPDTDRSGHGSDQGGH